MPSQTRVTQAGSRVPSAARFRPGKAGTRPRRRALQGDTGSEIGILASLAISRIV